MRRRDLLQLSWLLVVPIIALQLAWTTRTVDMYNELALRTLAHDGAQGMTLFKVGVLQFEYLVQSLRLEISQAVSRDLADPLPIIHLFMQEGDLAALDEARPTSGQNYVSARLYNEDKFSRVKAKYRGDLPVHWGFFKRSLRVKTKREGLFHGFRTFNLIAPKSPSLYMNHAGYEIARLLGILAPDSLMVDLNINGHYAGIHLLVEQISETTLRNARRLPGDIYSGDQRVGLNAWRGIGLHLFESTGLWEKVASNNHYPPEHIAPLRALLMAIPQQDTTQLEQIVDLDAFATFNLFEQITNSTHTDDYHNWRLYYDPGRAKFYPIIWDSMAWADDFILIEGNSYWVPPAEIKASELMRSLHRSENFLATKKEIFSRFINSSMPDQINDTLDRIEKQIRPAAYLDRAILSENYQWSSADESIERMSINRKLFENILDRIRADYSTLAITDKKPQPTISWQGAITLSENTYIDQPLTIAAGTIITLEEDVSLFVRGRLNIQGEQDSPVIFRPGPGTVFGAVVIEGARANRSKIQWLEMYGGSGYKDDYKEYSGMLSIHDVDQLQIDHCWLHGNKLFDDQLHVVYSNISISNCRFEAAPMDAVDLDMSRVTIEHSSFSNNGNDGLDLMGSYVSVVDSKFQHNQDKGISVGERSRLDISRSSFDRNLIGVQVKDASLTVGVDVTFSENATAIDAYGKNWRYGSGGTGLFCNTSFINNSERATSDKKSALLIDGKNCLVRQRQLDQHYTEASKVGFRLGNL